MKYIRNRELVFYQHKKRSKKVLMTVFRWLFILSFCYVLLYPLFFIVARMLKSAADFTDPTVVWVPKNFTMISMQRALEALEFPRALKNTVLFELVSAAIEVCSCAVAAYGLARFEFPYKKPLLFLMFLTILIPVQIVMLPTVLSYKNLDLFGILGLVNRMTGVDIRPNILDTPLALYLPSLFGVGLRGGLFIFIYMQFFKGLPKELEEAAWIDGATPAKTFLRIIVPSSGVVIITVSLFSFVWHWNDYYLALMYTSDNQTLSVMLGNIFSSLNTMGFHEQSPEAIGAALAACFFVLIIPLIFYMIIQRWFIQSIDRVGIVG